ncbi:uncharacterized mitochondrial protein AtMg00810-like [Nicotiana sylvestris]|uniref:uncharacterized mitochondrial protein AtMg00810-like n=1 Tax=Nicotiana sylvestris TaxID=4096 RepID=UPI00388C3E4B
MTRRTPTLLCSFCQSSTILIFVLIYVDDIIVTGSSKDHIRSVVNSLGSRFSLKDLGHLHFFLNIEVISFNDGLLLTQSKLIVDVLSRFNMLEAKGVATPMSTTEPLTLNDGSPTANAKEYCQFMHCPSMKHWQAAKRLLRHLKHTITYGLHLRPSTSTKLVAYTDADWGGDPISHASTVRDIVDMP